MTVGHSMLINIGVGPVVPWSTGVVVLAEQSRLTMSQVCVDRKRQWSRWRNLRGNTMMSTALYSLTHPRRARRRPRAAGRRRLKAWSAVTASDNCAPRRHVGATVRSIYSRRSRVPSRAPNRAQLRRRPSGSDIASSRSRAPNGRAIIVPASRPWQAPC